MANWEVAVYVEKNIDTIERYLRVNGFDCSLITNKLEDIESQATLAIDKLAIVIVDSGAGTLNNMVYDRLFRIMGMSDDSDIKVGFIYTNELIQAMSKKYKNVKWLRYRGSVSILRMLEMLHIKRSNDALEFKTAKKEDLENYKLEKIDTFVCDRESVDVIKVFNSKENKDYIKNYVVKDEEV